MRPVASPAETRKRPLLRELSLTVHPPRQNRAQRGRFSLPFFLAGRPESRLASMSVESYIPSCGVAVGLNEKPRPAAFDPCQVS